MLKNKEIIDTYGPEILLTIRKHEKLSRKVGRYKSHLKFCLQCKHCNVIPNGLKIKQQTSSERSRFIIKRTEKALLNLRIDENIMKLDKLKIDLIQITEELKSVIPDDLLSEIETLNKNREKTDHDKCS